MEAADILRWVPGGTDGNLGAVLPEHDRPGAGSRVRRAGALQGLCLGFVAFLGNPAGYVVAVRNMANAVQRNANRPVRPGLPRQDTWSPPGTTVSQGRGWLCIAPSALAQMPISPGH